MRGLFTVWFMLPALLPCFGVLESVQGVPNGNCPSIDPRNYTVMLPNSEDCSSFFMCSNGVPILQKCPEGLHFNTNLNVCDWPKNAECDPGFGFLVTDGGAGYVTVVPDPWVRRCPAVDPADHTVMLSNPDDCSSFFMCSNGVPILRKCPEGLHFNANLNVCDWPQNAGCKPVTVWDTTGGTLVTDPTDRIDGCPAVDPMDHTVMLQNPDDCSSFFMCSNGVPILRKCPEGLHFNANLNVCDWPQNAGCKPGGTLVTDPTDRIDGCPAVDPLDHTVMLQNPDDCSSFFMCSNGVPILQKCPEGLHFNAKLNVCDWPQNAGCEHVPDDSTTASHVFTDPTVPDVRCPAVDPLNRTVLLPNAGDCSSFFMCSNGVPILQKCPEGLHFNANLNVCDWPQNAGCEPVPGDSTTPGNVVSTTPAPNGKCPAVDPLDHTVLLPNAGDCSSFFMCSNGVPILQKCPEGLHFNAHLNVCDWPQNAGCENVPGDSTKPGNVVSTTSAPNGKCPAVDPLDHTVLLPNPDDCSSFFMCSNGVPILQKCPEGLHFNSNLNVCDWPQNVFCETGCVPLQDDVGGTWTPSSCTAGLNNQGATCKLQCNTGYQLRGSSSVQCTNKGWNSTNGNVIPKCQPLECIGDDLDDDFNKTLSGKAGLLFVLDESGSVTITNFEKTKSFVKNVVQKYPLSVNRSAGVITFDDQAQTRIHLNVDSTTNFLSAVDKLGYRGGNTDILKGLQVAVTEIKNYAIHNLTVVVLITDGVSSTDGTPAADVIKKGGNPLFAIGIDSNNNLVHLESLASTGDNGIKHFFHVTSYEALENIGKYLNPPAGSNGSNNGTHCRS